MQEIMGIMLDILILEDDREWADMLKDALLLVDDSLKIEATTSHNYAFRILSEKKPTVLIMEPNFRGEHLTEGKEYLSHVKEKVPNQKVVIISASSIEDKDMKFFKDHGVIIFLEKPSYMGIIENCNMLIDEMKRR